MTTAHHRLATYIERECPTALQSTNTYGDLDNLIDLADEALEEHYVMRVRLGEIEETARLLLKALRCGVPDDELDEAARLLENALRTTVSTIADTTATSTIDDRDTPDAGGGGR